MTIVHLFRRYKRWNPVHPTFGAFWGVGIGLGCGVGWGPGFGPEAVGFVGSGCGVGFSVGVTLIGVGVGLPASGLTCLPYDTLLWTGRGASNITLNYAIPALLLGMKQSWDALAFQSAALHKGVQKFCEIEVPQGREFVNQLQGKILRGLPEKSRPPLPATQSPQHRTQAVHFSRTYKWKKDSPSGNKSSLSSTPTCELLSDSVEETASKK